MKINYRNLFLSISIVSAFTICISAQTARNPTNDPKELSRRQTAEEVQNRAQSQQNYDNRIAKPQLSSSKLSPLPGTKVSYNKQFERTANLLVPPANYYEKYKAYLKDDKHELARLQPELNCTKNYIVSVQDAEKCADTVPVQGNGSYYSFISKFNYFTLSYFGTPRGMFKADAEQPQLGYTSSEKQAFINNWWDIHYDNNRFEVGRGGVQGIIADLGKRDLNEITVSSPELKFLIDYQPATTFEDSEKQIEVSAKGTTSNNIFYSNSLPAEIDHTYILRSVHYPYPYEARWTSSMSKQSYTVKGNEITIAFQIIGKESDGSLIILWKELDKKKLTQKYKI